MDWIRQPWPWYVAGPLIGLVVPVMLLIDNRVFGVSSSLRHLCAALGGRRLAFFDYDWKSTGLWNLVLVLGVAAGGFIGGYLLRAPSDQIDLAASTRADLTALGIVDQTGLVPSSVFSWDALASGPGLLLMVGGGFLVGFGSRYAGGCTSGHAISGLANFQLPSLVAVLGFFAGGLLVTHVVLPWVF